MSQSQNSSELLSLISVESECSEVCGFEDSISCRIYTDNSWQFHPTWQLLLDQNWKVNWRTERTSPVTMLLKKWPFLGWLIPQVLSLTWPLIFWTFQYRLLGAFWLMPFAVTFSGWVTLFRCPIVTREQWLLLHTTSDFWDSDCLCSAWELSVSAMYSAEESKVSSMETSALFSVRKGRINGFCCQ